MNHITEQIKKNEKKLEKKFVDCKDDWGVETVGYPATVSKLKSFLASAQLALLQAVREEVGLSQEITNYIKGDVFLHGQIFGSNERKSYITKILDEAIIEAKKNI